LQQPLGRLILPLAAPLANARLKAIITNIPQAPPKNPWTVATKCLA
jgi:hypothetical protein